MAFNKRRMEDARRQEAEKEAAARRATDKQILEDAEQLVTAWNERQTQWRRRTLARIVQISGYSTVKGEIRWHGQSFPTQTTHSLRSAVRY